MTDPHDHDQLATLESMSVSYERDEGVFTFEREFNFERSPGLSAAEVAESWELLFEKKEFETMEGEVEVTGELLRLSYRVEDVDTRHTLRHALTSLSSELITLFGTHDPDHAAEVAKHLLTNAKKMQQRD